MIRINFAAFLALASLPVFPLPAFAADPCRTVTASGGVQYLRAEKSGGAVHMTAPTSFPADVKPFVVKSDETFQDQDFQVFPLGGGGAGLALHYEGTLAEQYFFAFDRVGGKLKPVEMPNLNVKAQDYKESKVATIGGVPVLFMNDDGVVRIAPWQGHGFGPACEIPAK